MEHSTFNQNTERGSYIFHENSQEKNHILKKKNRYKYFLLCNQIVLSTGASPALCGAVNLAAQTKGMHLNFVHSSLGAIDEAIVICALQLQLKSPPSLAAEWGSPLVG
jgi:hypothetical protein